MTTGNSRSTDPAAPAEPTDQHADAPGDAGIPGVVRSIVGTVSDVVRDGFDRPVRWLHDLHGREGRAAWLVGRGWSATPERRRALVESGEYVMAVNDYPAGCEPTWFCTGDPPVHFRHRIWHDPHVAKFLPVSHCRKPLGRESSYDPRVEPIDCPNVWMFHQICNDAWSRFFRTPWINWGDSDYEPGHNPGGAIRTSLLVGLRLLYHLGFRRIHLLGVDCQPHAHPNETYYDHVSRMMGEIQGVCDDHRVEIVNCNPMSHLRTFHVEPFDDMLGLSVSARQTGDPR